jgi:hypothetical protein
MNDEPKHTYPSNYRPGSGDEDLDECWKFLDMIKPGIIPADVRAFLCGVMMGMISRGRKRP